MRILIGVSTFLIAATPAFAFNGPAPLIGVGLPIAAAVGGVLLVAKLFKYKK